MINKTKDLNNNLIIHNNLKEIMIDNNSIRRKIILIDLKICKIQIDMIINNRANSFIIIINNKEVKINLSNLSNNRNNFNNNNNNPFSSNLSIIKIISKMESSFKINLLLIKAIRMISSRM